MRREWRSAPLDWMMLLQQLFRARDKNEHPTLLVAMIRVEAKTNEIVT